MFQNIFFFVKKYCFHIFFVHQQNRFGEIFSLVYNFFHHFFFRMRTIKKKWWKQIWWRSHHKKWKIFFEENHNFSVHRKNIVSPKDIFLFHQKICFFRLFFVDQQKRFGEIFPSFIIFFSIFLQCVQLSTL